VLQLLGADLSAEEDVELGHPLPAWGSGARGFDRVIDIGGCGPKTPVAEAEKCVQSTGLGHRGRAVYKLESV
jgi:hypothetical protein